MELAKIILSLLMFISTLMNISHLSKKRKQNPREEQLYLLTVFIVFIISSVTHLITGISELSNEYFNISISLIACFAIFATATSFTNNLKLARFYLTIGLIIGIVFDIGHFSGLYEQFGFEEISITIALIIMTIFSIISSITILYYLVKTRISQILGLFIGIFIPTILGIANITDDNYLILTYVIVNIVIYSGFKGKLKFFELTDEQKRARGIPVYIGDKDQDDQITQKENNDDFFN
jgi:hypothetical protein